MDRAEVIKVFLDKNNLAKARYRQMTGDASARKYARIVASDKSYILMDAPPPQNVESFLRVAELLAHMKLSVPSILDADKEKGLLLLEDFGDMTFTAALSKGSDEAELYSLATDTLVELHRRLPQSVFKNLPVHDETRAIQEVGLLLEWYWPVIFQSPVSPIIREEYEEAWRKVLPSCLLTPPSMALFDFHVDNLMVVPNRPSIEACGLLDFQDAVIAPMGFDLASLLEDVRRDVPGSLKEQMIRRYLNAFPDINDKNFHRTYCIMAAQRNVRIVGTFARLLIRDNKPSYQLFMPRVWRLVEEAL